MRGFFFSESKKEKLEKAKKEKLNKNLVFVAGQRYPEEEKKVKIILDVNEAIKIMDTFIREDKAFSMDYETSGKKPQREGHFIRCMSLCNSLKRAYVFPIDDIEFPFHKNKLFMEKLKELHTSQVKKIAQNIKFEAQWTKYILGYNLRNIFFDTMIASHILDNSPGVVGLKYQVKKRYGIADYNGGVEPFITTTIDKEDSAHAFNRIRECPLLELLLYCGLDSLLTYRLYLDQLKEMDEFRKIGFDFFMDGVREFIFTERGGICVDEKYYSSTNIELLDKMEAISKAIYKTDEAKQWNEEKPFKFTSTKMLGILLFKILKYKVTKETDKGAASLDKEALEDMGTELTELILEYRRYKQILNFLVRFVKETVDGKLYPSYNLHTVKTMRGSSSDPNFQNIPKRDKEALAFLRGGLKPSPGNKLLEADYSGVEVKIGACIHKDPAMIKYIHDKTTDMHRDMARELFLLQGEVPKHLRNGAKNGFVFPQFYGDYYVSCARLIWKKWLQPQDRDDLKAKGIKNLTQFTNHVKKVEDTFWNKTFVGYTAWKNKIWAQYQKDGYIKLITGFVADGYMRKNEALNIPVQGPAFHCLLWSMIQLGKWMRKEKLKTKFIGQIHDAIVFDLDPSEEKFLLPIIHKVMCEDIREHFKWISVPLEIEAEISEINGDWAHMTKIKIGA